MFLVFVFINKCFNMYFATLKFYKTMNADFVFKISLGTFNRPSTAERLRRTIQDNNPGYIVVLNLSSNESNSESMD
ncbi:hypothetical protein [Tortoise microvirus 97]|nr:hypothetical protein [Tortoise microvirus 1]QCS37390.1 hypothetical protein [Tortoise microvirus 97]